MEKDAVKKTITLLGGTGAVGWPLAVRFLEAGWNVRVFSRTVIDRLSDKTHNCTNDLMKLQSDHGAEIGSLLVGKWDAAKHSDLLDVGTESLLSGKEAEQHLAALTRFASTAFEGDEDWFPLFESIVNDEPWAGTNLAISADTMIIQFPITISSSEVIVAPSGEETTMEAVIRSSDVVMNAVGIPSPDDCIASAGKQRQGFLLNSVSLYKLGKLWAQLKPEAILATCSTNYVFELAGFPDQLTDAGYLKQNSFPVLPRPVGLFRHPGEALANAFGVIDVPDPTDKALRRKTVYPATRYIGEHALHAAAGANLKLLTFRFPGFYTDVGIGSSNTVLAQLDTTPADWNEKLITLKSDLDSLSSGACELEQVSEAVQKAIDAQAKVDANLRWVLSSTDLANRIYEITLQSVEGTCPKEAVHINGESPNVKSDWTLAGFLAYMAHHKDVATLAYLNHESEDEARFAHIPVADSASPSVSPQHMFDVSIYPDANAVPGKLIDMESSTEFFMKRRELGIKQMARNLVGINRKGKRAAFELCTRYGSRLDEIFQKKAKM